MSEKKYHVIAGEGTHPVRHDTPSGTEIVLTMDDSKVPGSMFNQICWYKKNIKTDGRLVKHQSDELVMFIGSELAAYEDLNATFVYQLGNDVLEIDKTGILYVPANVAHGLLEIRGLTRPVLTNSYLNDDILYEETEAAATEPAGTYLNNYVAGFDPNNHPLPRAPPGFLQKIMWIDEPKLKGAPYMEGTWCKTVNMQGPPPHVHHFDEVLAFIGTDPDHPEDLNADVWFDIDGQRIQSRKSYLVFAPKEVPHSPILIPELEKPIIHFSGGGKGGYQRDED